MKLLKYKKEHSAIEARTPPKKTGRTGETFPAGPDGNANHERNAVARSSKYDSAKRFQINGQD
jgi:hypothetical protein